MRLLALSLAVATLGGCSILTTKSVAAHGPEKCTTSAGPPAVDTAFVAGAAAFATYAAFQMEDVDHIATPAAIGFGIVMGISAIVGYTRVSTCKQARIKNGLEY